MDASDEKGYIFNIKLAKIIGLYQILNPDTVKVCGYNVFHVVSTIIALHTCAVSVLLPFGMYYLKNDDVAFVFYLGLVENLVFACFKSMHIVYYSKDIWECMDVTIDDFVSNANYDRKIFEKWRNLSVRVSSIYTIFMVSGMTVWLFSPLVFDNNAVTIKHLDGSYSEYRANVYNLYMVVSDETYNRHFNVMYFIEIIILFGFIYFTMIFDVLTVTMCFAMSCHLEKISDKIASLGHESSYKSHQSENDVITSNNTLDIFYQLTIIIKDHQGIIGKMNDYYNIVRSVMLFQIVVSSSTHIYIWFIFAVSFYSNEPGDSILSMKLLIILPTFSFQLYITCVLFGTLNEKKDSIIFALYSCNWTAMDIKSKKLVLFIMMMNNANKLKLKFTNTKIVNLEMFSNTMQTCYSVFSMLINYNKNKNKLE